MSRIIFAVVGLCELDSQHMLVCLGLFLAVVGLFEIEPQHMFMFSCNIWLGLEASRVPAMGLWTVRKKACLKGEGLEAKGKDYTELLPKK